ncbi:MAG: hypothetical protein WB586_13875, partial [Chthoniobacterales bacterium]
MSRALKFLETQRFCVLQTHCEWLDAQARAGINDSHIGRAAVSEFLYGIQEKERQAWIADARARTPDQRGVISRNGKYSVNGILSDIPSSGIFRVVGGDLAPCLRFID